MICSECGQPSEAPFHPACWQSYKARREAEHEQRMLRAHEILSELAAGKRPAIPADLEAEYGEYFEYQRTRHLRGDSE